MPAEWARHEATWLTYPKNPDSWPGKIETIYPSYHLFVKTLAESEHVHINVDDASMQTHVQKELEAIGANMQNIFLSCSTAIWRTAMLQIVPWLTGITTLGAENTLMSLTPKCLFASTI